MKNLNGVKFQAYNGLDTDYKAEVIAYYIWKKQEEIDGVLLKRLGSNNRSFHKDLKQIKEEFTDANEKVISVESYREGLYDYLPEGIFHPPSLRHSQYNIVEVVEQIRHEKRVEQKQRAFFQPFELEVYFCQLKAFELTDSFDGVNLRNHFVVMLEELWPLLKLLDDRNAQVFAYLLPHFHAARGKRVWIEQCLTALLQVPVQISFTSSHIEVFEALSTRITLGDIQLGLTTVLADAYCDGGLNWKIEFGPIPYEELHLYLEGSPLRGLLQAIYDYCLPNAAAVIEMFVTLPNEHAFIISTNNNSLLGYSTYL
ncbi:type VI secretion system baseplate subunit TssG [Myroides odoratus]|uniref:type VI secretion system baseplate subunit TssG n=1 Tax=Myroides odoratus TaxID=256 RepID=UPI00334198D4